MPNKQTEQQRPDHATRPSPYPKEDELKERKSAIEIEENEDLELDEDLEQLKERQDFSGHGRTGTSRPSTVDEAAADDEDFDDPTATRDAMRNRDA